MRVVLAFLFGLLLGGAGYAEEPVGDRILPANPQFLPVGRTPDGATFVEITTMGRVGDTGYVWEMFEGSQAGAGPIFNRLVIDCVNSVIQQDWMTALNEDLANPHHVPGTMTYEATDENSRAVVGHACGTEAYLMSNVHEGIVAAVDWARSQPAIVEPFDLGATAQMSEVAKEGRYEASFTRRDRSNVYDGTWTFTPTGQTFTDQIEVVGLRNGDLVIRRLGVENGEYSFPMVGVHPGPGTANWVSDPTFYVTLVYAGPEAPAPIAQDDQPPGFDLSLALVATNDAGPRAMIFAEENWTSSNSTQGFLWVFYAYGRTETVSNREAAGMWARFVFDCEAPLAVWTDLTVYIDKDYAPYAANHWTVDKAPTERDALWQLACSGTPMASPASSIRIDSLGEALRLAAAR